MTVYVDDKKFENVSRVMLTTLMNTVEIGVFIEFVGGFTEYHQIKDVDSFNVLYH